MTVCTIDEALEDRLLLGAGLGDLSTWATWRTVLKATYGLQLDPSEVPTFDVLAGGRPPPRERVAELWAVVSRRSGKSRMAAAVSVYVAAFIDHSARLAPGETGYVLVLSPSKSQARTVRDYCEGFIRASPDLEAMLLPSTTDEIRLCGNIVIAVHPASHRTVRGKTLLAVILDEVAYFRDEKSATPDIEVYRAVVPALATTYGILIAISSPYRKVGLLHQKHDRHFGKDGDVLVIQAATELLNPTIDRSAIERSRADDPEAAQAEWDGQFRGDLSSLLDDAVIEAAIDHDRPIELPPLPNIAYRCFADASAGRHDAFCIGVGHKEGDRLVIDVVRGRKPPFDPASVAAEYAEIAKSYRCLSVAADAYAGEWVSRAFEAAGVRFERSPMFKSALYLEMVAPFMRGTISIPNHPVLVRELRLLERRVAPSGKDRVDHPQGGSDDHANVVAGVMSLLAFQSTYTLEHL